MQHPTVCRFFLQGRCREGDNCKFLHAKTGNIGRDHEAHELPPSHLGKYSQNPNAFNHRKKQQNGNKWNSNRQENSSLQSSGSIGSFNPNMQDNKFRKDSRKHVRNEVQQQNSSSLLFHLGNQEYLRDLNADRDKNMLERLVVQSAFKFRDQALLTFLDKPFIVDYDLRSYDFTSKEQKYIHVNINHSISALTISSLANFPEEFLLVAYNNFNEITMVMTACLGLIPLTFLGSGQNFFEIPISNEAPITLIGMSKNFIGCTFQDPRTGNSTLSLYQLSTLSAGISTRDFATLIKQARVEYKINDHVTSLSIYESLVLLGTQNGDVKIFNGNESEMRNFTGLVEGEIVFLELCYQDATSLQDFYIVCVAKNGQIAISNLSQPRSLHTLSQQISFARFLRYKEGLVNKAMF